MEKMSPVFDLTARRLTNVLSDFKISGEVTAVTVGPIITLYQFEPIKGTKVSKITGLAVDIARCMSVSSARITLIPGSTAIGIELPNKVREIVSLPSLFNSDQWRHTQANLPIMLGKNMVGDPVIVDLAAMPHLLIAGTTGSGKSVGIHTIINSLLHRFTTSELRLILVDPKMLELSQYTLVPHLLTPVITDPQKAVSALKWTLVEMERRYRLMSELNVRNINFFNELIKTTLISGDSIFIPSQVGFDEAGEAEFEDVELPLETMAYIVVVIDEVADLMMVAGKEIEVTIHRLSQMARAAGIHVVMATQRPSVDIITGSIKANFPSRISFQLQSKIDSRTIIGQNGAEQLTGNGDMLLMSGASVIRIQGAFISNEEIQKMVDYRCQQQSVAYLEEITEAEESLEFG